MPSIMSHAVEIDISKILILYEIVNHVLITLQTIYPTIMALHVLLGIYAYFTTTHNYYELMMMSL